MSKLENKNWHEKTNSNRSEKTIKATLEQHERNKSGDERMCPEILRNVCSKCSARYVTNHRLSSVNFVHEIKGKEKDYSMKCMVFSATFNNISAISWRWYLLMRETGANHLYHWHTLSDNVFASTPHHESDCKLI